VTRLAVESYWLLLRVELFMRFRSLHSLHALVRRFAVRDLTRGETASVETLCHAMDIACAFYPKRIRCLQRSAATVILLRRRGVLARMVIGAQVLPLKAHAWVEVADQVVNDKPYMYEIYQVLERC
jgi:hypothetical protein